MVKVESGSEGTGESILRIDSRLEPSLVFSLDDEDASSNSKVSLVGDGRSGTEVSGHTWRDNEKPWSADALVTDVSLVLRTHRHPRGSEQ